MNRLASIKFGMALAAYQRIKKAGASDDALARAQFLEGVTGKPFNSLSGRNPMAAIAKMLIEIYGDPTMDVKHSPWMRPNTSVYDNVLRGINGMVRGRGEEILQESTVQGLTSGKGNFFYQAGKQFKPEAVKANPEKALTDMAGRVLYYARKRGIDVIRAEKSMEGAHERSGREPSLEGDTSEIGFSSLRDLERLAMEDPHSAFGRGYIEWVHNTTIPAALTKYEGEAFLPFFDAVMEGTHVTDTEYADQIGMSRPQFGAIKKKYKDWMEANFKRMSSTGHYPKFIADAQEAISLANEFRRKAARKDNMARNLTAAERDLRSKVIRLAHQNPALRPHLLPLLKQADAETAEGLMADEIMAGRPWGGPGYKPKAKDYDDPAPGPGSPPCTPDGEGGCYEHTTMYKGYGTANSGTNGSAARREYNKKYREMLGL